MSRSVGVVESLLNDNKDDFTLANREKQAELVRAFDARQTDSVNYQEALSIALPLIGPVSTFPLRLLPESR